MSQVGFWHLFVWFIWGVNITIVQDFMFQVSEPLVKNKNPFQVLMMQRAVLATRERTQKLLPHSVEDVFMFGLLVLAADPTGCN